jgi:hypothetical protein
MLQGEFRCCLVFYKYCAFVKTHIFKRFANVFVVLSGVNDSDRSLLLYHYVIE